MVSGASNPDVSHRVMQPEDLHLAVDWAAAEGWNPGLDDVEAFLATDPGGFFVAEHSGKPVAAISVVNHSPDFAFLGLYLCLPEYRGRGIGYGLWKHALDHAGNRILGLDGVPDQQENYRKSGFTLVGQTYRFTGHLEGRSDPQVRAVTPTDIPALLTLDTTANGYAKPMFLRRWLTDTQTRHSLVLRDGIGGFVTIRACREGHKIGPVIADNIQDAETLIRAAIDAAGAAQVMIDVPDSCQPLMAFCEDADLSVSFNTARMYRGMAPQPGLLLRTIATMELG